jgi:hypothetical protein
MNKEVKDRVRGQGEKNEGDSLVNFFPVISLL